VSTFRVTYKRLLQAVEEWNQNNGLKYLDKGFLMVKNDGNVHWLGQISRQGHTGEINVPFTNGTLRSCWERVQGGGISKDPGT